jgi:hypothetical protein
MSAHWFRPTDGLTLVIALPPEPRQYGFGWNWRGYVWGVWHKAGTSWWRWHTPEKIAIPPDPPEGYEWGLGRNGELIHVPAAGRVPLKEPK